jgi:regulatory protein
MPKPLDKNGLMAFAAQALSARALTISELRDKLNRRAAEPLDVDYVLARLKESGYLNDQRFSESYASWRRDDGGFGKTRVMRDLMARRVAPAVAKQAAEAAFEGADEIAMIEAFLKRKYRGKDLGALLQEEKRLASAYRKLRTAGFSTGNSIKVLKIYAAQAELLEEIDNEQ